MEEPFLTLVTEWRNIRGGGALGTLWMRSTLFWMGNPSRPCWGSGLLEATEQEQVWKRFSDFKSSSLGKGKGSKLTWEEKRFQFQGSWRNNLRTGPAEREREIPGRLAERAEGTTDRGLPTCPARLSSLKAAPAAYIQGGITGLKSKQTWNHTHLTANLPFPHDAAE